MIKRRLHPRGRITKNIVTPGRVNKRARELALIAGRRPIRRTASDLRQAKQELVGDERANAAVDDPGITSSGFGAPPVSHGRRVPKRLPTDDETEARTVEEGVNEAEHDEMLQASKHPTANEE